VFPRHTHVLPTRLQGVWTDDVIMTCKPCGQALQYTVMLVTARKRVIVPHRAADRSRARWAEATTPQDGATLYYDLTGRSYAVDRSPRKTDETGHTMCRPRHHYPVSIFNVLASV
jgi:hypothetical protein